jgi:hypothetical protein
MKDVVSRLCICNRRYPLPVVMMRVLRTFEKEEGTLLTMPPSPRVSAGVGPNLEYKVYLSTSLTGS